MFKTIIYQKQLKLVTSNLVNNPTNHYSQDPLTTARSSQTSQPQSSARISFQENLYTFDGRHASLSEPLLTAIRQAPLGEPQYETAYNTYRSFLQDLNMQSKTKIKSKVDRQFIHPPRNRKFATPKVKLSYLHHPLRPLWSFLKIQFKVPPSLQTISPATYPKYPIRLFRFNTKL